MKWGLILVLLFTWVPAASGEVREDSGKAIDYLLDYVESSRVVFMRNGREHTAGEAADHMRKKYAHFKDDIKTPEDFIRLTATRSLRSGQPYKVRTPDGQVLFSREWLERALRAYRSKEQP